MPFPNWVVSYGGGGSAPQLPLNPGSRALPVRIRIPVSVPLRQGRPADLPMGNACRPGTSKPQVSHQPAPYALIIAHSSQIRSEEHTSELQSRDKLVCSFQLENKMSLLHILT